MGKASVYNNELNLEATALRLALPGSDEREQPTSTSTSTVTSKKRSSHDLENNNESDEWNPPSKAQIVGWPPVQSYRKRNNFQPKKSGNGSGSGSGLFVKVNVDGVPFMRKIDLMAYESYGQLLNVLEGMFRVRIGHYSETEGYYSQSDCAPSYEDKDGDWMLVGDVPWEMFVLSCKRLRIMKTQLIQNKNIV